MDNITLRQAFSELAKEKYSIYHLPDQKHRFSLGYRINKHFIIRKYRRQHTKSITARPVLRTELVILLILLATLGAMSFITYFIINGFRFEDHNTYSVVRTENSDAKSTIERQYCLTESSDLVFIGDDFISTAYFIDYEFKGNPILFYQGAANGSENTNTENKVVIPVDIGDYKGFFIQIDESEGLLEWYQDGYYFTISGIIDKENAINLAQLTKLK